MQETPFVALVSFVLAWAQTLSSGFTRRRFVRYLIWLAHLRWHSPPIWLAPNAWLSLLSCIAPLHVAVKLLGFRSSQMAPLTQLGSLQILGTLPARWLRSVAMALSCRLALTPRSRHPHGLWLAQAALAHSQALTRSACVAPSHNLTRSLALVPSRRPRLAHTHGTLTLVDSLSGIGPLRSGGPLSPIGTLRVVGSLMGDGTLFSHGYGTSTLCTCPKCAMG